MYLKHVFVMLLYIILLQIGCKENIEVSSLNIILFVQYKILKVHTHKY